MVRGLDAGADDFVRKPFNQVELLARIRSMLRIKTQYDLLEQQRRELEVSLHLNRKFARVIAHHLEELEILHHTSLKLMTNLDSDSVLNLIAQTALEILPEARRCFMHLVPGKDEALLPVVFFHETNSKIIYPNLGFEALVQQVLKTQTSAYIPDLQSNSFGFPIHFDEARSLLVVPMLDEQHLIGTLGVYSIEIDAFDDNHKHVLSILASQATTAIIRARFFETKVKSKEEEKELIRRIFQRYVSPAVVERLVKDAGEVALGGQRQEISILFADIRNFSNFSENSPSEHVVEVLNRYFSLAVEAILAEDGTLDKFMGDAVMAIFNAPLRQADDTMHAIRAALAMQQAIADYNANINHRPLMFGIGIHTGQAVVGNIGAAQQMNYTAIGDTVNVAKRLQESADGGEILLSQAAYEAVEKKVVAENLGTFEFKGRASTEQVYKLVAPSTTTYGPQLIRSVVQSRSPVPHGLGFVLIFDRSSNWVGSPPVRGTAQIPHVPARSDTKATQFPSGERVGRPS